MMEAILTGDIIGYTSLPKDEQPKLLNWTDEFLSDFNYLGTTFFSSIESIHPFNVKIGLFPNSTPSHILQIETFRGDSFQAFFKDASYSIRLAFLIRTFFLRFSEEGIKLRNGEYIYGWKNLDVRLAIGIGKESTKNAALLQSDGEAFRYSGRAFDTMDKKGNKIVFSSERAALNLEIKTFLTTLEAIVSRWTAAQAHVVYYKLFALKEQEIADKLHVGQSTVNRQAKAARWQAIEEFLTYFEQNLTQKISE